MKAVLIANIGNNDLGKGEKSYFNLKDIKDIYGKSKELYESKTFTELEPIILNPIIRMIKKRNNLVKIYLFATEQNPINKKDTWYIAKIIKELLSKEQVELFKIMSNPSDFDLMYTIYNSELKKINEKVDFYYISITGGTQAENLALLINALLLFGPKLRVVYKPDNFKEAKELDIGKYLNERFLSKEIETLKKKYLFLHAAELGEKYNLLHPFEIKELKAKGYRLLFDFDTALNILNELKDYLFGKKREKVMEEIKVLDTFRKRCAISDEGYFKRYLNLLIELYDNMKIKWEQGAYVDFIGRLFRFEEALLRFIFEIETKVSTDKINGKYEHFVEYINKDRDLHSYLLNKGVSKDRIEPNIKVLRLILEYWVRNCKKQKYGKIYSFVESLHKQNKGEMLSLSDLRNKTILAHGFVGVSKDIIERIYGGNLLNKLEDIVSYLKQKHFTTTS